MNQITITGNLTKDPEIRYTQTGTPVANFSVAVNRRTLNKDTQQWEDDLEGFFDCSVWNDQATAFGHLHKGDRVIVTGTMIQRHYETEHGERRTRWELRVDEMGPSFRFGLPKRNNPAQAQNKPPEPQPPAPQPPQQTYHQPQALPPVHQADADIPF